MKKFTFNKEINLSRLGMGAMRLPQQGEGFDAPIDYAHAEKMLALCMEQGVNYYDTAYIYHGGGSELFLGKALSKYPRESYYIADKFNLGANPDYRAQFAEQLDRLQTDYIDFYMFHGVQDYMIDSFVSCGSIDYFNGLKADGKIKYFGVSYHGDPEGLRKTLSANKWDFVQLQINYFDWLYGEAKALYEIAERDGIPVMAMEPVRGGLLAKLTPETGSMLTNATPGRSVASWAMRWLMDLPQIAVILSGMSDVGQVADNIATFSECKPLSESEKKLLTEVCELFRPAVSVACTNCRYCVSDCPKKLDIPRMLSIYNDVKLDPMGPWRASFLASLPKGKRAEDCIACGKCSKHCPQGFDIPGFMKELAAAGVVAKQIMNIQEDE